ncbi:armadillo repeat-containing protein 8 isoform X2 [Lingula anatina]|uniref:Armadillo repeat-containing protein 8 n=1 Tax=Lingula anatina TaxID=7574 RepID=A0A1S3I8H0_LINAN|nr:armadillo repeat-containing protein 8 isoform X2 [Lingula anatina]|eukprot:XP_013393679.1 armadillo repeat-containing protein 8 isoform X2 [Lingula anatina]
MIPPNMEVDGYGSFLEEVFGQDPDNWLQGVVTMKNAAIGNNKQKAQLINMGVVPRLLQFMLDDQSSTELRVESAVVLGSLAKGTLENIQSLIDIGTVTVMLKGLCRPDLKYVEACLRCLRTIFISPLSPIEYVYQDASTIPHLISIMSLSAGTQECVTNILAHCCKTEEHQAVLCSSGAIIALAPLLCSNVYKVQMPALKCFAQLCYKNDQVSIAVATASYCGERIPDLIAQCLTRDRSIEMQIAAAKSLTYLCRAGAIDPHDPIITMKTLPTLVRMCKKDKSVSDRVEGAETLAYLTEVDMDLQQMASVSDHLIKTLAEYFRYSPLLGMNDSYKKGEEPDKDFICASELRQAAFRVFASLAANDEDIRKKVIETENLMDHIVNGLQDTNPKVQLAAVRCMHSLSRSVQQLRTSFQDHSVWKPLMKLITMASDDVLTVASSTLCNLLLEFSPSKEPILDLGAVDLLVALTKRENPVLRLNGIWALMNMTFQAEEKVKSQILTALGTDQLFRLLSDPDVNVLMKTLGLLRNLLSNKPHIDHIMSMHGIQIMQAVILILEGDHPVEVKEQTLCILANVADGDSAKDFIMGNEDVLKKLMNYMMHSNVNLQIAATFCICNLIWNEEESASERQAKLTELGVHKLLQQLLSTNNTTLFDKVKTAMQQFT